MSKLILPLLIVYGLLCFWAGYQLRDNVIPALQSRVNAEVMKAVNMGDLKSSGYESSLVSSNLTFGTYREFPSVEAYQEWGTQQPLLGKWTVTFTDNKTIASYGVNPDCDEQAEYLQRRALNDGYLVSQAIVNKNGYIANTYVADVKGNYHTGLITAIGNNWYYMDSFTRDVIKIQLTRD